MIDGDTPMQRKLFVEMTQQEQTAHVEGMRERRLRVVHKHRELLEDKRMAELQRSSGRLAEHMRMAQTELDRADKAFSKVEERLVKISALRALIDQ